MITEYSNPSMMTATRVGGMWRVVVTDAHGVEARNITVGASDEEFGPTFIAGALSVTGVSVDKQHWGVARDPHGRPCVYKAAATIHYDY